jgi:hypothetical protein
MQVAEYLYTRELCMYTTQEATNFKYDIERNGQKACQAAFLCGPGSLGCGTTSTGIIGIRFPFLGGGPSGATRAGFSRRFSVHVEVEDKGKVKNGDGTGRGQSAISA